MIFDVEPDELLQIIGELYIENRKLIQIANQLNKHSEDSIKERGVENEITRIETGN